MGAHLRVDSAHALRADHGTARKHSQSLPSKNISSTDRSTTMGSETLPKPARLVPPSEVRTPADRSSIGEEFQLSTATEKDHDGIHRFLVSVFQSPSAIEFEHTLEAPRYEPLDRLLFKRHGEIVAHVQLHHQTLQFGDLSVPTIDVRHLATLPEYRSLGLASRLMQAVENDTNLHGAVLATVRATTPKYFSDQGWVPWLSHCYSTASPRALISQLELPDEVEEERDWRESPKPKLVVRHWRRNELSALRRLYATNASRRYGGLARDEADWQWLISGQGCDFIYVASENGHSLPVEELTSKDIVGYAVVKDGRVVELVSQPNTDAARQLLIRMSSDAIEEGRHIVELDAAPDSSLHLPFLGAGGRCRRFQAMNGRTLMAKLFRPDEFLQKLRLALTRRAIKAGVELPSALGVRVGFRCFTIKVGKRQATIVNGDVGGHQLELDARTYNSMLLGQQDLPQLIEAGRAKASSSQAAALAAALFPRFPTWRMPWEDLPARAAS